MNERTNERTNAPPLLGGPPAAFLSLSLSFFLSPRPRVRDAPFLSKGFEKKKKKKKKKKKNGEEWVFFFQKKIVFFSRFFFQKFENEKILSSNKRREF